MALVFHAHDLTNNLDVVIKVPKQNAMDDKTFLKRFASESRALMKLRHPGVVQILHVGTRAGWPFAVLQFLSGGDLDACREAFGGKLTLLNLSKWLPDIANALDFIHEHGYIHRDVKPANVLFDGDGKAFLSDFGIAKVVSDQVDNPTKLTGTGLVLGTPDYMAPELIMGNPIDGRVDQFALAMTVYECLAGRLPFPASTPAAKLVKQTTEPIPKLHEVNPAIPGLVSDIVMQALSRDPQQRFGSCSLFADQWLKAVEQPDSRPISTTNLDSPSTPTILLEEIQIDTSRKLRAKRNSVRKKSTFLLSMKAAFGVVALVIVVILYRSFQDLRSSNRSGQFRNQEQATHDDKPATQTSISSKSAAIPTDEVDSQITPFVGRWRIINNEGKTASYFTLTPSLTATKSHAPSQKGTWEVYHGEARIVWSGGWRDILRPQNEFVLKIAFQPGRNWDDSPTNIERAVKVQQKKSTP